MAQDNEIKQAVVVGSPENAGGAQSGETTLIPDSTTPWQAPTDLNGTASTENLSAKYKYPQVSEDVPVEGQGQYQ